MPPVRTLSRGGSAAARRALLAHRGQRHLLQQHTQSLNNSHNTSSSSVNVGNVHVNTAATDASGIAADMREAMRRELLANQSNYGLA
jgi:hypothetical protein